MPRCPAGLSIIVNLCFRTLNIKLIGCGEKKRELTIQILFEDLEKKNEPIMIKIIWILYDLMSDTTFNYLPAPGGIF